MLLNILFHDCIQPIICHGYTTSQISIKSETHNNQLGGGGDWATTAIGVGNRRKQPSSNSTMNKRNQSNIHNNQPHCSDLKVIMDNLGINKMLWSCICFILNQYWHKEEKVHLLYVFFGHFSSHTKFNYLSLLIYRDNAHNIQ